MGVKYHEADDTVSLENSPTDLYAYYKGERRGEDKGERFLFPKEVLTRYVLALLAKPLVILTGISGTGKTKIAQVLVDYLHQDLQPEERKNYLAFVSARPDWTDNRGLLGFYNPLERTYHSTRLLELLIRAGKDSDHPYFIILDEMNLAKVEYYFSDFLSKMETRTEKRQGGEELDLHELSDEVWRHGAANPGDGIPGRLHIPSNVFVSGTVTSMSPLTCLAPRCSTGRT